MAKDSPRTTAGELQKKVESWGQKTQKTIDKQYLHHHMLFGRVLRKIILAHPKTISIIFSSLSVGHYELCRDDIGDLPGSPEHL